MHRYLLASTAVLALAAPAAAETISTAITTPVRTSTVKAGTPDAITITDDGSVKPTTGTAVTLDSNHNVTNEGDIAISNSNGAVGIHAEAGVTGEIVNAATGTIVIDETYSPTDANNDGDLDGPFALGANRFGIRTAGTHTGRIVNNGTITVEGNDSAGIWLGGLQNGEFTHNGTTTVAGDRAVGVHTAAIAGNVRLAGVVTVRGDQAVGARFTGDVSGAMVIQGAISSSGYRYTAAPASTANLDADDLLQGGIGVLIEGNVAGGIVLAVAPANNSTSDNDEDDDGIDDDKEGNAAVSSFGAAPAMAIGATDRAITIGAVAGTSPAYGFINQGNITGAGVYTGVDGNGLVIGGRGGAVTITNGLHNSGTISASTVDAAATALRIGSGATVPEVRNSGTVSATTGNTANSRATALRIDQGASVATIRNSGTIKATASGTTGIATAIRDLSGGVTLIENSGTISATDLDEDEEADHHIAIDLSANTSGATVRQTLVAAGVTAPSIAGDVRFGTGNDLFDVADGTVTGDISFGTGNNTLNLSGDAVHSGDVTFGAGNDLVSLVGASRLGGSVDFGGGADSLSIAGTSVFSADLVNAGNLAVTVSGGALSIAKPVSIGSLSVGASGTLHATLDKTAGEGSLYTVAGTASFADGATLLLSLGDTEDAEGRYTVLQAGTITGRADLETDTDFLPFMFKASVATNAPANTIAIDIAKKSAEDLELNRSQASAYDAIFAAINEDDDVEDLFLAITDGDQFRGLVRQMLPDHAGAAFEGVSLGTRTFGRQAADPQSPVYSLGGLDVILSTAGWSSEKDEGDTAAYNLGGLGFSAAGEIDTAFGAFGVGATWFWNDYDNGTQYNNVQSDTYELAAYWRGKWGGLSAFARGSAGLASFSGRRTLQGTVDGETIERTSESDWDGTLMTFSAGASYEGRRGSLFFRPTVSIDYLTLSEDGYTDTGGDEALDLIVDERDSDELAANAGLAVGFDVIGQGSGNLLRRGPDTRWFRVETEGGWREVVGGALGSTTARFEGGEEFTLDPEENEAGWYARLRAVGGGTLFEVGGEAGAEQRRGETAFSLRGTVRIGF
ncbi:MAG: autotransporter domain-containing protein [Sphingomonadales bacterium 32-68-7]|nr:MAG: autotransporter domain-containing protein [Sphingomonadales bacterium 12-68-11]OYX09573.1 MAG: autotransporter domain-containing protein [Sphingomonadales bacterium 32-68-7]